jgi:hypothetical protein
MFLLEMLMVTQLFKKFPAFMKPESSQNSTNRLNFSKINYLVSHSPIYNFPEVKF